MTIRQSCCCKIKLIFKNLNSSLQKKKNFLSYLNKHSYSIKHNQGNYFNDKLEMKKQLVSLFNGILTFMGYLMPKLSL